MRTTWTTLLAWTALSLSGCQHQDQASRNEATLTGGAVNLTHWDFDKQGVFELSGGWRYLKGDVSDHPKDAWAKATTEVKVPGDIGNDSEKHTLVVDLQFGHLVEGAALYVTAGVPSRMTCESELGGTVSGGRLTVASDIARAHSAPYTVFLPAGSRVNCAWSMYVPAALQGTFVLSPPQLGLGVQTISLLDRERLYYSCLFFALLTISGFFAVQGLARRDQRRSFWVSLTALAVSAWLFQIGRLPESATGLHNEFWQTRIQSGILPLMMLLAQLLFFSFTSKKVWRVFFTVLSLEFLAIVSLVIVPTAWVKSTLFFTQVLVTLHLPLMIAYLGSWYRGERERTLDRLVLAIAFGLPPVTGVLDFLVLRLARVELHLMPLAVVGFLLSVSIGSAYRSAESRKRAERKAASIRGLNQALARFVPSEILQVISRKSASQTKLGDAIQKKITILFADIRNFRQLTEGMSGEEKIKLLNTVLARVAPLIRKNGGVIDKYVGDSITAFFPESPYDAIMAAQEIQKDVLAYNAEFSGKIPLAFGLGVHQGEVILGTVGDRERIDATVVAQSVNLAVMLERIAKQLHAGLLVSDEVYQKLPMEAARNSRWLGNFETRGKKNGVQVYEIFNMDSDPLREHKWKTSKIFETAIRKYQQEELLEATADFDTIYQENKDDGPTHWWLSRIDKEIVEPDEIDPNLNRKMIRLKKR